MNRDSMGIYGCPVEGTTPNMDKLASEGMRFEHGHVTIAICQPCRAVWMTGRYPQNNGALGFHKINKDIPTLPETLRAHGFYTGVIGKTEHMIPSRAETAYDFSRSRWDMHNGRNKHTYRAFFEDFLAQAKAEDKPFFFIANAHDPHRPFDKRTPADKRKLPEGPTSSKNKQIKEHDYPAPETIYQPEEIVVPGFLADVPDIREEIAQYYTSVKRADEVVWRSARRFR